MAVTTDEYVKLITSEYSQQPHFVATVSLSVQPFVDEQNVALGMPTDFDLDVAVGAQLDIDGLWIGVTRQLVLQPYGAYYASADMPSRVTLLDADYRALLKAIAVKTNWDGAGSTANQALNQLFSGTASVGIVLDRQDMTYDADVTGAPPSLVFQAMLVNGLLIPQPGGVLFGSYTVVSTPGPLFGFNLNNEFIAGFNVGKWGAPPLSSSALSLSRFAAEATVIAGSSFGLLVGDIITITGALDSFLVPASGAATQPLDSTGAVGVGFILNAGTVTVQATQDVSYGSGSPSLSFNDGSMTALSFDIPVNDGTLIASGGTISFITGTTTLMSAGLQLPASYWPAVVA